MDGKRFRGMYYCYRTPLGLSEAYTVDEFHENTNNKIRTIIALYDDNLCLELAKYLNKVDCVDNSLIKYFFRDLFVKNSYYSNYHTFAEFIDELVDYDASEFYHAVYM